MRSKKQSKLQSEATKLHTHTVVFKRGSTEEHVAIKAQAGKTTKRIAIELGMTMSEVQYRISKAQRVLGVRFRAEYRNGGGLADVAEKAIAAKASQRIQTGVSPSFAPFAASRLQE